MVSLNPTLTDFMHRQIRKAFNIDETCVHRGCIICCQGGVRQDGSWLGTSGVFYDSSGICETCVQTHVANNFQYCTDLTEEGRFVLQFWVKLCICPNRFSANDCDFSIVKRLLDGAVDLSREALFKSSASDTKPSPSSMRLWFNGPPGLDAPSASLTTTFQ